MEDTVDDAQLLLREITKGGLSVEGRRVETAAEMNAELASSDWDIVISDYSLPQFSAPAALRLLQEHKLDIPFLIVSGAIGEEAAIEVLTLGAGDFIVKGRWARLVPAIERELVEAENRRQRREADQRLEQSLEDLSQAYDTTLAGWARALELRDAETEGHSNRVTALTVEMAQLAGLSRERIVHVRRGALLHDIGKMGVPDAILLKAGPLTEDEWTIMRRHPLLAYEMLLPIAFLGPALEIPLGHHERWDGMGYPDGLKGEEIPLPARLFAVVDVWDALCSARPYKEPWPEGRALAHIQSLSGSHFDRQAVELFEAALQARRRAAA